MCTWGGRYMVHFRSDGVSEFLVHVRDFQIASPSESDNVCKNRSKSEAIDQVVAYSVALTPDDVHRITTHGGVAKSFFIFAEMTYDALIGKSSSLTYHVETQDQLEKRIEEDVRARLAERPSLPFSLPNSSLVSLHKQSAATSTVDAKDKIELSRNSGDTFQPETSSSLFLTIDYDVNFTRGIFPLPLKRVSWGAIASFFPLSRTRTNLYVPLHGEDRKRNTEGLISSPVNEQSHPESCRGSARNKGGEIKVKNRTTSTNAVTDNLASSTHCFLPTSSGTSSTETLVFPSANASSASPHASKNHSPVDRQHLAEALKLIEVLHKENATLKKENTMLARLSKDKMKEIRELCQTLAEGAAAIAEVKRLKDKNVQLRVEIEEAKENAMRASKELEVLQRRYSLPARTHHCSMIRASGRDATNAQYGDARRFLSRGEERDGGAVMDGSERKEQRRMDSAKSPQEWRRDKQKSQRQDEGSRRRSEQAHLRRPRVDTPPVAPSTRYVSRKRRDWSPQQMNARKSTPNFVERHYDRSRLDTPPTRHQESALPMREEASAGRKRIAADRLDFVHSSRGADRGRVGEEPPQQERNTRRSHPLLPRSRRISSPTHHRTPLSSREERLISGGLLGCMPGERSRRANSRSSSSRCSSRSHERLFQMPTAASRERVLQQQAEFQKSKALSQYSNVRSRLAVR